MYALFGQHLMRDGEPIGTIVASEIETLERFLRDNQQGFCGRGACREVRPHFHFDPSRDQVDAPDASLTGGGMYVRCRTCGQAWIDRVDDPGTQHLLGGIHLSPPSAAAAATPEPAPEPVAV
jgi:hypothetical protein